MSKKSGANAAAKSNKKKNAPAANFASQPEPDAVTSIEPNSTAHDAQPTSTDAAMKPPFKKDENMTLSLKGLDKRSRNAIYTGAAVSIRIPVGAFPSKTPPATLEFADGSFAASREKKAPMTAEERKAARKAQPQLTLAEKVAKAEERTAKLREKLAADAAKASAPEQPSL